VRTTALGEATVDPDERARATFGAIDRVLRSAGRRAGDIAAVSVSTFWHSVLGIDDRDRPTTPVLTWADTRASAAAAALRADLDQVAVHARTGCTLHASYLPAKLAYLREAHADAFEASTGWLSLGEYLTLRIFGERRASHGMASATGLYAQRAKRWDEPILDAIGIDERSLSPISDEAHGSMRPAFRRRWPALANATWYPAIGDGACSNLGCGAVTPGTAALMVGTSGALRVVLETDDPPNVEGGWTYRVDERRAIAGGALSNAGNVLSWLGRTFPSVDLRAVAKRAGDAGGLVALPLLAGDRSPSWDDGARAAIAGIGLGTSPEAIAQAMIEGVAHRFALLWTLVDRAVPGIERLVGTGGWAVANPWLLQLLADALDRPVVASNAGEGSGRGAAVWGLERIGALRDIGAAPAYLGRTYRPRPGIAARLRAGAQRQSELERALAVVPRA
jgi:gluconokinase